MKQLKPTSAFSFARTLLGVALCASGAALAVVAVNNSLPQHTTIADEQVSDAAKPMPVPEDSDSESDKLNALEQYWMDRLTYPTGKFDPAWLRAAAQQDAAMQTELPAGNFARFNLKLRRGAISNPLALPTNTWTALGPQPERMTGCSGCFDYTKTAGRVNAIAVDPTTTSNGSIVAYVGTVGGGVWKTTNCCSSSTNWTVLTDDPLISTTAIDDVVLDPNNHNTIYAGTGDLNYGSFSMGSQGVLKSTDGGASWKVLGGDVFTPELPAPPGQFSQYNAVGKVRVDPNNSNNIVAGTKTGLYFSYDGGVSWKGPFITNNFPAQRQDITGLELTNVGGTTRIIAAVGVRGFATTVQATLGANGANGIYVGNMPAEGETPTFTPVSTNANGFVFGTQVTGSPFTTGAPMNGTSGNPYVSPTTGNQLGRIDIAVAPSNPNVIYAQVQSIAPNNNSGGNASCGNTNGCQLGAWYSNDGGNTWNFMAGSAGGSLRMCNTTGPSNSATTPGDYPQNWYDQHVTVDPNDPNKVWFQTFEVWFATQNGNTWYDTSCAYSQTAIGMHADEHFITFVPGSSSILLASNDGGIDAATDADTTSLNTKRPTWFNMDNGLNTIEFYAGDISGNFANDSSPVAVGGAQDNGPSSVMFSGTPTGPAQWQMGLGGDGFSGLVDPMTAGTTAASGTITVSAAGTVGQQFKIGTQTFTWQTTRVNPGDVAVGTTSATAATNIRTAVNADLAGQVTASGNGSTVTITAATPGPAGNSIPFMNINSANLTFNGSGTLGGTTQGGLLALRLFEGNNSGGFSRCVGLCTQGGAPWSSVRGGWASDLQSFVLPVNIFHGGIPGGDDCAAGGPTSGCGHLLAATTRVWETITGSAATVSWYQSTPATCNGTNACLTKGSLGNRSFINMVKYSPKYQSVAIIGTNDGNVQIGFNLGTGVANSGNWVDVTGGNTVLPNRSILGIALDANVPSADLPVGYAAVGGFNDSTPATPGHVFQVTCTTSNCASFTWLNKTGNLPDIPCDSVISNPLNAKQVFAGTDWGVYFTNDITAASPVWTRFNVGMPHTMVWDFQIDRGSTTLSAWTRGRGAWVYPLPAGNITAAAPTMLSAASRKVHGSGGTFDLPLALSGPATIEPRTDGTGKFTVVFNFDSNVSSGSATSSSGNVDNVTYSGNSMIVNLSAIQDTKTVTVTANNISGPNSATTPSATATVAFLGGDVNGDRFVNSADVTMERNNSGQVVDNNNFRTDVNLDGFINVGDTVVVRNRSGNTLSPANTAPIKAVQLAR